MSKKLALLLAVLMLAGIFAACGPAETTTTTTPPTSTTPGQTTTTPTTTAPAAEPKVLRTYLTEEANILNGHDSVNRSVQTPHDYCSSSLYRVYPNEDGTGFDYIGDLAEGPPVKIDTFNWQITLREEAVWNNGEPINADTMMYSFKMLLDPILANQMADFLAVNSITIVNAKEYAHQADANTVAWEDVGIKKIDDRTIQITTVIENTAREVSAQFTDRSTFPVYEPLYEAGMNDGRTQTTYGTTLDEWMGCGPYFFETWEYGNTHVYVKNPDHWLADLFKFDEVDILVVPEMNARIELWESGKLDYLLPNATAIDSYIDDPRMVSYETLAVFHIDISKDKSDNPLRDFVEYRKAVYHAIDREVLARDIYGHMKPSGVYINGQAGILSENALTYRNSAQGKAVEAMVEEWGPYGYNPELAKEYMDKAFEKAGLSDTDVVTLKYICSSTETNHKAAGEYLMEQWDEIFGGKIKLEVVTYAGMSTTEYKMTGAQWDLSPNDWTRAICRNFPYACFSFYISSYGTSPNDYFTDAFDAQYAVCDAPELKSDYNKMLDETKKLEEIYLEDVIHAPIFQNINYEMFSDKIILPVDHYIPGVGWGLLYADCAQ